MLLTSRRSFLTTTSVKPLIDMVQLRLKRDSMPMRLLEALEDSAVSRTLVQPLEVGLAMPGICSSHSSVEHLAAVDLLQARVDLDP